ncbi:MAG: hypothetical protein KZQ93_05610 [Candidatus Thiodiazotropha sp. (ex Monitilora ramsayi)]|nr:hypothetical protein [Candidatus Thiodiazotropha sp. (ex Monitilora ramsayi)]
MRKLITFLILFVSLMQSLSAKEYEGKYENFNLDFFYPENRWASNAVYYQVEKNATGFYDLLPKKLQHGEKYFIRKSLSYLPYADETNLILSNMSVYELDKTFNKEYQFPDYPNSYSYKHNMSYHALMLFDVSNNKFSYSKYPIRHGPYLDYTRVQPYKCLVEKSMSLQDIDLDGIPEVFVFGGGGGHSRAYRGAGMNRWMDFYIFSLKGLKPIFYSRAKFESYAHNDNLEYIPGEVDGVKYQSVTMPGFYLDSAKRDEIKQGIQTEARYFFGDFNKDDVLDVIVWDQWHLSRKVDDPKKGYYLDNEQYLFYSNQSSGFKDLGLSKEEIKNILKDNELTWGKGFPQKDIACK